MLDEVLEDVAFDICNHQGMPESLDPLIHPKMQNVHLMHLDDVLFRFISSEDDDAFLRCFLISFWVYLSHADLIQYILNHTDQCRKIGMKLSYWIGNYEGLWKEDHGLRDLTDKLLYCLEKSNQLDKNSADTLRMMMIGGVDLGRPSQVIIYAYDFISPISLVQPNLSLFDLPPIEVARCLSLIDQNQLISMQMTHFFNPNNNISMVRMTQRFDDVLEWTATSVQKQNLTRKSLEVMSYFIHVATVSLMRT